MKTLPKKYAEAKNKFQHLSDVEMATLQWKSSGSNPGIIEPLLEKVDELEADYDLSVLIQLECQRRKLIDKDYIYYRNAHGNFTNR